MVLVTNHAAGSGKAIGVFGADAGLCHDRVIPSARGALKAPVLAVVFR